MEKFLRQTRGCRDQNVPLNLPPLLSGRTSRVQIKSGLFAQGAAQLRKLLFIALPGCEESRADGRRYFIFQTLFVQTRCVGTTKCLLETFYSCTVLFDPR